MTFSTLSLFLRKHFPLFFFAQKLLYDLLSNSKDYITSLFVDGENKMKL